VACREGRRLAVLWGHIAVLSPCATRPRTLQATVSTNDSNVFMLDFRIPSLRLTGCLGHPNWCVGTHPCALGWRGKGWVGALSPCKALPIWWGVGSVGVGRE
jgi:hypothetical protein